MFALKQWHRKTLHTPFQDWAVTKAYDRLRKQTNFPNITSNTKMDSLCKLCKMQTNRACHTLESPVTGWSHMQETGVWTCSYVVEEQRYCT